jgi:cytoskeleton-associated protein 5
MENNSKSDIKSTNPRVGSADDADLLALRAHSNKSSTNRFVEDQVDASNENTGRPNLSNESKASNFGNANSDGASSSHLPRLSETLPTAQKSDDMLAYAVPPGSTPSQSVEVIVTADTLEDSLKSSNWQLRNESYLFLQRMLESALSTNKPMNQLNGEQVFPSLGDIVIRALSEKNAGALDAALSLSLQYTDSCREVCSEDCLTNITSALLKGTAFSSSRKSTMLLVEDLVLKMFEVSSLDSSSIQAILELLEIGLKSKKPKVVTFSAKLILRSIQEFGVGVFPIPTLSSHSEILISNSNNEVRDVGLNIVAELCRALGSKTPLQSIVDKMKPAQQSQLDALISAKQAQIEPTRRLRCQQGTSLVSQSPEDILASMKLKEEENKAKNFAARPAVNLFQVLPQTCYKEKIKLDKWSEKVAALEALIKAGGEEPYKLLSPQSNAVNYIPLVRELTQLLGHTHFAVVSKSLEALGMLAEGVGEDIYPQFRPLILTLVGLFKDKKVCKAVASCLDKMFGNVFSFEHLLDNNDSLPSSLDEKRQKNALVRVSVLEFLSRCVSAAGRHGTRGQLTPELGLELCRLSCSKLQDSDASTRKAASGILLLLL